MLKTISDIPLLAQGLRQGKTLLYPTDTIWGLGCSALSDSAISRLYAIKERDPKKSMLVLLPDDSPLLSDPHLAELLLSPRPTTVIIPTNFQLSALNSQPSALNSQPSTLNSQPSTFNFQLPTFNSQLASSDGTIGVRIPRHPFCQALIKALGCPLVSTSANLSGHPSPTGFDDIDPQLLRRVDLIASPTYDTAPPNTPSSRILRLLPDGQLLTIRE